MKRKKKNKWEFGTVQTRIYACQVSNWNRKCGVPQTTLVSFLVLFVYCIVCYDLCVIEFSSLNIWWRDVSLNHIDSLSLSALTHVNKCTLFTIPPFTNHNSQLLHLFISFLYSIRFFLSRFKSRVLNILCIVFIRVLSTSLY